MYIKILAIQWKNLHNHTYKRILNTHKDSCLLTARSHIYIYKIKICKRKKNFRGEVGLCILRKRSRYRF